MTNDLPPQRVSMDYYGPRLRVSILLMLACLGMLLARLWHLQLVEGESYGELSKSNRVRLIRLPPTRGRVLDSNSRVLAENIPSFTFSIIPGELENPQDVIETCSSPLGITQEKMRALIERSRSVPRFMSFPIKKNLTLEEVALIKVRCSNLKGVVVEAKPVRHYPWNETLCHEIGTMGEISNEELAKSGRLGYRTGDMIGKSGIEKEYETYLRGEEGWEQIEIDAKGRQLSNLSRQTPTQGRDVVLTVDAELQRYAEDIFIHRAGSIVAVDPDTGRVLVAVSKPGFDLNYFSPTISKRHWQNLNNDPLHPLENRVIRGLYSPGSTFKMVTAAAGLAEKAIKPETRFVCKGELELWGQVFRCWNRHGHGSVDLRRAIVESCDVYFYELGLRLGVDRLARYASLFGMGKPTGLALPHELPGLIPTATWKERTYGDTWKDGETVNLSIGQGYLVTTPIQLAMMTAALANHGTLFTPSLVRQIRSSDGDVIFDHEPAVRWTVPIPQDALTFLDSAMQGVVENPKGTGKKARLSGLRIAAKTGTSQVIREKEEKVEGHEIPYHERTHAIFIAYVNDRPKKIAVAVVVEHGGGGGASAGPLARKVIARYYGLPDPGDSEE